MTLAAFGRLHYDLSIDEPFTALAIARPWSLGATLVHDNLPLFYGLLLGWVRLFGASAFALRAMSTMAFGGAIVFSAAAARAVASDRAAALTALLVGGSVTFGLQPGATARPYALVALFAAMALWAALRAETAASPRRAGAGLLVSHLFGLFTHPIFLFVSAASAAAGTLSGRRRSILAGAPAAAIVIYLATYGPSIARTAGLPSRSWMSRPGPADLVTGTLFWGDHNTLVLAALVLILVAVRRRPALRVTAPKIVYAAVVVALVLAGAIALSQITPLYHAERTPVFVLPAVALVFGVLLAELGPAFVALAVAALVVSSAVRHTVLSARQPDPFPTHASLAAVASRVRCGDSIVAVGLSYAPLRYYNETVGVPDCVPVRAFPDEVRSHPGWLDLSEGGIAKLHAAAAREVPLLPDGTIWMFVQHDGVGSTAANTLIPLVLGDRPMLEMLPLRGSFFDEVRVYGPRAGR